MSTENEHPPLVVNHAEVSVEDQLRHSNHLHAGMLQAVQLGIAGADSTALQFAPSILPNLSRHFHINDALIRFLLEEAFSVHWKGTQATIEQYCANTHSVVKVLLMRGNKKDLNDFEVFEVNPKTSGLAYRVAENLSNASTVAPLFPMDELISNNIIPFSAYDASTVTTVILFWQSRKSHDLFEDEEVTVFVAKPLSIDGAKTLIQCEWVETVGTFNPAATTNTGVLLSNLPVAPAYEPSITPLPESDDDELI